jgi:hypothetical protein
MLARPANIFLLVSTQDDYEEVMHRNSRTVINKYKSSPAAEQKLIFLKAGDIKNIFLQKIFIL